MLTFILGMIAGAAIIMLTPPEYEDRLRQGIINLWKNFTSKG